jgi:hypothetical protein
MTGLKRQQGQVPLICTDGVFGSRWEHYRLEAMQSTFTRLVEEELKHPADLRRTPHLRYLAECTHRMRRLPRRYLCMHVPVFTTIPPENGARLRDISETGIGAVGISASVSEVSTLMIRPDPSVGTGPILFEACCRWVGTPFDSADLVAGFEIIRISPHAWDNLRGFIDRLVVER